MPATATCIETSFVFMLPTVTKAPAWDPASQSRCAIVNLMVASWVRGGGDGGCGGGGGWVVQSSILSNMPPPPPPPSKV